MKNWSSVKKSKKKIQAKKKRKKLRRFCSTEKLSRLKVSFCHLILACVCFERAHARTETQVLRQKICQKFWARKKGDIQYKQRMISYFRKKKNMNYCSWRKVLFLALQIQSKFSIENWWNLSKKKLEYLNNVVGMSKEKLFDTVVYQNFGLSAKKESFQLSAFGFGRRI